MLIHKSAAAVVSHTARERSQYALNAVCISRDGNGNPCAVASDGRRLIKVTWPDQPAETTASEYPALAVPFDHAHVEGFKVLIPPDALTAAAKATPKRPVRPILEGIVLEESSANGTVRIATTDLDTERDIKVRTIEGEYPDFEQVIPPPGVFRIGVNPDFLIDACKALKTITSAHTQAVTFSFEASGPDRAMTLSASSGDGVEAIVVIMPMSID